MNVPDEPTAVSTECLRDDTCPRCNGSAWSDQVLRRVPCAHPCHNVRVTTSQTAQAAIDAMRALVRPSSKRTARRTT